MITKKRRIDKNNITKLNIGKNSSKYKVKIICNKVVYIKKLVGHLLRLYHLIS